MVLEYSTILGISSTLRVNYSTNMQCGSHSLTNHINQTKPKRKWERRMEQKDYSLKSFTLFFKKRFSSNVLFFFFQFSIHAANLGIKMEKGMARRNKFSLRSTLIHEIMHSF
ncbi:hypothetical protein U1Q18_021982 [Sarracenia purpurea var. burkii]